MSQADRILDHLAAGKTLTRLDAWDRLGVVEAPARICELRAAGFEILTETIEVENRYGEAVKVARWSYPQTPQAEEAYLKHKRRKAIEAHNRCRARGEDSGPYDRELAVIAESLRALRAIAPDGQVPLFEPEYGREATA